MKKEQLLKVINGIIRQNIKSPLFSFEKNLLLIMELVVNSINF